MRASAHVEIHFGEGGIAENHTYTLFLLLSFLKEKTFLAGAGAVSPLIRVSEI